MARKSKSFDTVPTKGCGYQTFTIKDEYRTLAYETIIMRAALGAHAKPENFSEFIRNLIVEENTRQRQKL